MQITEKQKKILDRLIIGFVILFLVSLTNSIFINQIGYFGALLLIILKVTLSKEKQNYRTGLELPFILFLSAELISALFSVDQSQALKNFLKRLLLIPIVYTIVISADDLPKAKLFLKIYITAAVLTVIAYLTFAYRHYVFQLYALESKGPSPFQYVMTAGGLISFVVVILFAFIINEKTTFKIKLLIFIAFIFSTAALLSSYTRAAWLGTFAGILVILFLKKKWVLLIAVIIVPIILIAASKNESLVNIYNLEKKEVLSFPTEGRANSVYVEDSTIYVADYEKGLSVYNMAGKFLYAVPTPSPALKIDKWQDNYYIIFLFDTRILIAQKDAENKLQVSTVFLTPGLTRKLITFNNNLYVSDEDSGLTIYKDPEHLADQVRINEFSGMGQFYIDSLYFTYYDVKKSLFKVYENRDFIPSKFIDSVKIKTFVAKMWTNDKNILLQSDRELYFYKIENNNLVLKKKENIVGIFRTKRKNDQLFSASIDGRIFQSSYSKDSIGNFNEIYSFRKNATDYFLYDENIFFTSLRMNRFASIIDPYHDTNLDRVTQWKTGLKILKDYPLFGVGDIDLYNIYSKYKEYYQKDNYGHLHNNYVHILVILGSIGFIIVIYMLFKIFITHLRIYKQVINEPVASSFALGAVASFVGFLVSGLAEWNFGDQEIITMVWFILGLNIAFYKSFQKKLK